MNYHQLTEANREILQPGLIKCYKEVFAAHPWNEDWWTDELVLEVIERYAGNNAVIILALLDKDVVGFAWGAVWHNKDLSNEVKININLPEENTLLYVKDIGVKMSCRGQGLAKKLLSLLLQELNKKNETASFVLARTLAVPFPSVVYRWFPKIGFKVQVEYPIDSEGRGQVILSAPLKGLDFRSEN